MSGPTPSVPCDHHVSLQDMEEHEQERSKFLQSMFYKYVDLHIAVHEKSGEVSPCGYNWLSLIVK